MSAKPVVSAKMVSAKPVVACVQHTRKSEKKLALIFLSANFCPSLFPCQIPPTALADSTRLNLKEGTLHLMYNTSAVLCVLAYSISFGVSGHWIGVMAINFEPLGISETEVREIAL